jgi:hypothetical protein
MQTKLRRDAAQFVAERGNRFRLVRSSLSPFSAPDKGWNVGLDPPLIRPSADLSRRGRGKAGPSSRSAGQLASGELLSLASVASPFASLCWGRRVPADSLAPSAALVPISLSPFGPGLVNDAGWMGTRLNRRINQSAVSAYT